MHYQHLINGCLPPADQDCGSASEIAQAEELGVEIVKIFPGKKAWFQAGVSCVGMGSKLVRKDLVEVGNWTEITRLVRQALDWIKETR